MNRETIPKESNLQNLNKDKRYRLKKKRASITAFVEKATKEEIIEKLMGMRCCIED